MQMASTARWRLRRCEWRGGGVTGWPVMGMQTGKQTFIYRHIQKSETWLQNELVVECCCSNGGKNIVILFLGATLQADFG